MMRKTFYALCGMVALALAMSAPPAMAAPLHVNPGTDSSSPQARNVNSTISTAGALRMADFDLINSPRGSLAAVAADLGDRPADGRLVVI